MKKLFFGLLLCIACNANGMMRKSFGLVFARNLSASTNKSSTHALFAILYHQREQLKKDIARKKELMKALDRALAHERAFKKKQEEKEALTQEINEAVSNMNALAVRTNNEISHMRVKSAAETTLKESDQCNQIVDEESPEQLSRNKFW